MNKTLKAFPDVKLHAPQTTNATGEIFFCQGLTGDFCRVELAASTTEMTKMISTHFCPRSVFALEYVEKDGNWYFFDYDETWIHSDDYSSRGGSGLQPITQKPGGRKMMSPCDKFEYPDYEA